jgi:hypothetical protein
MFDSTWGADCIGEHSANLPDAMGVVWAYNTGTPGIPWSAEQRARFDHGHVYTIDQGYGSKGAFDADEFDLEARAWTVPELVEVVEARAAKRVSTRIYCSLIPYAMMQGALAAAGLLHVPVFYRLANWNLNEPEARARLGGSVYAVQWASPTSNPDTLLPGTKLTLAEANVDLNVVRLMNTGW